MYCRPQGYPSPSSVSISLNPPVPCGCQGVPLSELSIGGAQVPLDAPYWVSPEGTPHACSTDWQQHDRGDAGRRN